MLVGGTRTPLVHRLMREKAWSAPLGDQILDLIVALGASISAFGKSGARANRILVDIASHSFG